MERQLFQDERLITLWTGRRPAKRTCEILCFYFAGLVTGEELLAHLAKPKPAAKKSS